MHKPKIVNLITKILLTLAAIKTIESASKGPITHAAWSPLCTLSKDKQKLYNRANKLQDDISNFFQTAAKASIKATIVAVKLNSADAMKAAMDLQAKMKADVTAKRAAAEQFRTIATVVTMRAAYLHGRIAEFIEMMTAMRRKTSEHACLSKQGDGTDRAAGETIAKQQATCKLHPEELTKHSEELTELMATGYPKLTLPTGLTTSEQGGDTNPNCIFLTTTANELNGNGGFKEAIPLAAGYLLRKEDMTANSNQAINQLQTVDEPASAKTTVRPYVELWKAFKQLKACEAMFSTPYSPPSAQALVGSPEVKTAIKNHFLRKEGQYEDSKDNKDVDPIIKRLYKADDEHYPKTFW
uniref:Variant surface glycoprotein 1125.1428 n=1 Tax=Trypanosoma brucei TaxID=5691 RepID=A0A1J0R7A8_9TRYP|nr:variant surface glycoprotein 1125.1428 [Trypanosoma brucei]